MFESTFEKDLHVAESISEEAVQALHTKIIDKFRGEFLVFFDEVKASGIAEALYNASGVEEAAAMWTCYFAENQELISRIKAWAEARYNYFDVCDPPYLFPDETEPPCSTLEIGLILFMVQDECMLSTEDINDTFFDKFLYKLSYSPCELVRAAGCYYDCNGFDNTLTAENVFDFYPEEK